MIVKKKVLTVVSVSLSLMLAAALASSAMAAPNPTNPFSGRWYSYDGHDGSYQTMTIGGSDGHFRVTLRDTGADSCTEDDLDLSVAGIVTGMFSRDGDTISGTVTLRCLASPSFTQGPFADRAFTYYSGSDRLVDNFGDDTNWCRMADPSCSP
jgi:hypothetical protein